MTHQDHKQRNVKRESRQCPSILASLGQGINSQCSHTSFSQEHSSVLPTVIRFFPTVVKEFFKEIVYAISQERKCGRAFQKNSQLNCLQFNISSRVFFQCF